MIFGALVLCTLSYHIMQTINGGKLSQLYALVIHRKSFAIMQNPALSYIYMYYHVGNWNINGAICKDEPGSPRDQHATVVFEEDSIMRQYFNHFIDLYLVL